MIKNLSYGKQVLFNENRITMSFARNGSYACTGVDIFKHKEEIQLTGITSRGKAATGRLSIPVEDINELIKVLKLIK